MHFHPFPHDVFAEVDRVARQLDAAFGRGLDGRHGLLHASKAWVPRIEVDESDDAYTLTADVPGLQADALDVHVDDGVLTLEGRTAAAGPEGWERLRTERAGLSFTRRFSFRRPIDADAIVAQLRDGVLTVTVPKRAPRTHTIDVTTA